MWIEGQIAAEGLRLTDAELVVRVSGRDQGALAALYSRYGRLLYRVALQITQDVGVAEEVLQDTLLAIWRSAGQYRPEASVAAWLVVLARHRAIDTVRSRGFRDRRREQLLLSDTPGAPDEGAEALLDAQILRATVRAALDSLSQSQREVIELAYFGGLTHSAIAERIGAPLGTVKARLRAAVERLRGVLRPELA